MYTLALRTRTWATLLMGCAWKIEFNAQYFVHFPRVAVVFPAAADVVVVVGVFAENAIHVFRCLRCLK